MHEERVVLLPPENHQYNRAAAGIRVCIIEFAVVGNEGCQSPRGRHYLNIVCEPVAQQKGTPDR
jgi:hypothetical protein